MRELHAWENGHHVGVFSEDDEERISFAYDANEGLPISLSLPRTGGWRDQAPRNFLDNLLPDNPNVRQAMREHLNASSAGVFDLLDRVDATGGLVFSLSPEPPIPSPTLRLISDSQIANEIDRIDASGSLSYRWLERLAFNTSSANSDAHAKNYSLILDPASGIRLSPQYDAVATRYWPEFNWELTMPLNEDHAFAEHTTPQDWEDLATRHGLDGSRVADMARRMAGKVLAGISESCEGLDARMADRLNACWTKANESIEPIMPGDEPANSLDPASALPDSLGFPSSGRTI